MKFSNNPEHRKYFRCYLTNEKVEKLEGANASLQKEVSEVVPMSSQGHQ